MPWCPKCRRFQEEDDLCIYCWVETVEKLESEPQQKHRCDTSDVLLMTVSEESEASIVQGLLRDNQIHSIRKYRGAGSYLQIYMGMSNLGIDIYVSQKDEEQARKIIENHDFIEPSEEFAVDEDEDEDEDEEYFPETNHYDIRRRKRMLVILGIFFLLNLVSFIVFALKFDISFG